MKTALLLALPLVLLPLGFAQAQELVAQRSPVVQRGPVDGGPGLSRGARPAQTRPETKGVPTASPYTLARVRAAFAGFDRNGDGRVVWAEAERQGIDGTQFRQFDADGDGAVTAAEFVLAYRNRLAEAGQARAADLEAEATRLEALRRAQSGERERLEAERRRRAGERADGSPAPTGRPVPAVRPSQPVRPGPAVRPSQPVRPVPAVRPAPAPATGRG